MNIEKLGFKFEAVSPEEISFYRGVRESLTKMDYSAAVSRLSIFNNRMFTAPDWCPIHEWLLKRVDFVIQTGLSLVNLPDRNENTIRRYQSGPAKQWDFHNLYLPMFQAKQPIVEKAYVMHFFDKYDWWPKLLADLSIDCGYIGEAFYARCEIKPHHQLPSNLFGTWFVCLANQHDFDRFGDAPIEASTCMIAPNTMINTDEYETVSLKDSK